MTAYYISPYGADANNGLGPDASHASNKPWLTPGKALGAAGIASGDTVYMAPGYYHLGATTTVNMTSATAETFFIGDYANSQGFKDSLGSRLFGGAVRWSTLLFDKSPIGLTLLVLNGRDFLTFRNISFLCGNASLIDANVQTSTNIKIQDCVLGGHIGLNSVIKITVGAVNANWVVERCLIYGSTYRRFEITLVKGAGADYDCGITLRNIFMNGYANESIAVVSSGITSGLGGGLQVINCTIFGSGHGVRLLDAGLSSTIPARVYGCQIYAGITTALDANVLGQIVEDYNKLAALNLRSNVAVGQHSTGTDQYQTMFEGESEIISHRRSRLWVSHAQGDPHLGFGNDATYTATDDLLGFPRPNGTIDFGSEGIATGAATKTLTDSGKAWGTDQWRGWILRILAGAGSGQTKQITSNTGTVLTLDGNWAALPSAGSTYIIYQGVTTTTGIATAGAASTLTDANAAWYVDQWIGYTLGIIAGTGIGQSKTVTTNTATALTVNTAWATNPDATSIYVLYKGQDADTVTKALGCTERGDTFFRDATTVHSSGYSMRALGPATQDFEVPVGAVPTQIAVWARYNAYYVGTKPQMKIITGGECGVADATVTMTLGADSWELLTLSFTPTRAGIVTVRFQANSTAIAGSSFFSDMSVTQ